MHVELFVGPLTAHFAPALLASSPAGEGPSPVEVRAQVEAWQAWLSDGLVGAGHLSRPLTWSEADSVEPQRFRVSARALRALKLLLVQPRPESATGRMPARPELDPSWVSQAEAGFAEHPYPQVLVPEFWLPGDFDFTFVCPLPDGHEVQAGSTGSLGGQLAHVRENVLGGTPFDVLLWSGDDEPNDDVRRLARHANGVLEQAVAHALEGGMPMLVAPSA
ncbi:MAG: hypothetical protein ACO4CT_00325 [Planctomycetota bacterium]